MITGGRGTKIFEEYLRLTIENSDLILDIGTSERFAKELRPYKDWFTHQGLELLFQYFSEVNIEVLNGPVEMLMTNARLFKLLNYKMIRKVVDIIDFPKVTKQTTRHLVYAIK